MSKLLSTVMSIENSSFEEAINLSVNWLEAWESDEHIVGALHTGSIVRSRSVKRT